MPPTIAPAVKTSRASAGRTNGSTRGMADFPPPGKAAVPVKSTAARGAVRENGKATRDPEQTRQRILDAAKAEFSRVGLGGARVDRIALEAGANKRMLYYYFGNKAVSYTHLTLPTILRV